MMLGRRQEAQSALFYEFSLEMPTGQVVENVNGLFGQYACGSDISVAA